MTDNSHFRSNCAYNNHVHYFTLIPYDDKSLCQYFSITLFVVIMHDARQVVIIRLSWLIKLREVKIYCIRLKSC